MLIIKLWASQNYIEEIYLSGQVLYCYMPYEAKKFRNEEQIKPYLEFLNKKGWRYSIENFEYSTTENS